MERRENPAIYRRKSQDERDRRKTPTLGDIFWLGRGQPKSIVCGDRLDVDDQVHDTPKHAPPKPPAETGSRRNVCGTYSAYLPE